MPTSTTFDGGGGSFNPSPAPGTKFSGDGLYVQYQWGGATSSPTAPTSNPTPISPTFDPKIEANTLYGKPMTLAAIGSKPVRFGGAPAPIVGPYINAGKVDFLTSIGLICPVDGSRKLFKLYLDQELAWSSATGWDGSGAQPGDAIYHAETFDLAFRPGTITQAVCSLETAKFSGDENAYRPQVLIEIRNLPYQRYMDRSGRPVPYVSADIGDFSDGRGADEQINLGEALELIAHSPWAGYTSSTFEAVGITDAVDGILIKDNFTVVDLCRSVTRIYRNIDLLQSDKLRVKDRGNVSPDFVFDRDSIIGGEGAVQISRAGATAQRRLLELIAIDPDQDYTAVPSLAQIPRDPFVISAAVGKETITSPLVLDASTRQALVTFAQQYEENARKRVAFKVRAVGYEIEPGDLFALPNTVADGVDGEVFKCTQTVHGANYEVEVEGEAILRCGVYVQSSAAHQQCLNDLFPAATSKTFSNVDFGDENDHRYIVVGVNVIGAATPIALTDVTIGGVAAAEIVAATHDARGQVSAVWYAALPTDGTSEVVIETDSNVTQASIHVYRIVTSGFAISDTDDAIDLTGLVVSNTVDIPANGIAISVGATRTGAGFPWTGTTETCKFVNDIDTLGQRASALRQATVAEPGHAISVDPTSIDYVTLATAALTI